MQPEAVAAAREMLNLAEKAAQELTRATNSEDAAAGWFHFLWAAGSVPSKLKAGAKNSNKSTKWYAGVSKRRKADPLLQYVHQARNAADHGVAAVSEPSGGHLLVLPGQAVRLVSKSGKFASEDGSALPDNVVVAGSYIRLIPVLNFGVVFEPPRRPIGMRGESDDIRPFDAAVMAIDRLNIFVEEAEQLLL